MNDTLWLVVVLGIVGGIAWWLRARSESKSQNAAGINRSTTFGSHELEAYVRGHIVEIAEEQFPDNLGLQWTALGFQYREDLDLAFAEVEPRPDEVGYSRFQFAFVMSLTGPPQRVATYCLESGKYTLLSTSPGAPKNLPKQLG